MPAAREGGARAPGSDQATKAVNRRPCSGGDGCDIDNATVIVNFIEPTVVADANAPSLLRFHAAS